MKINLLFLVAFFFLLSHQNTFSQDKITLIKNILTLEGEELFKAFDDYGWRFELPSKLQTKETFSNLDTLDLYWKVLDKAINSKPSSRDDRFNTATFLRKLVYDILIKGRTPAYLKLINIYKNQPDTSIFKGDDILVPLCNYYIFNTTDSLIANKISPKSSFKKLTNVEISMPITKYYNELKEDALLYKSLENHYQQRIYSDTSSGWYYVQKDYSSFYNLFEDILLSDSSDHMKNLIKYNWGGWCGTGSEFFYEQKVKAELILLLRERDYYSILGNYQFYSHFNESSLRELTQLAGLNWTDVNIGATLNGKWNFLPKEMTQFGGNTTAQKIIKMEDYNFKNVYNKMSYLGICRDFLIADPKNDENVYDYPFENPLWKYWENHSDISKEEIAIATKDTLETILINSFKDEDNLELCQFAIRSLGQLKFDDKIKSVLMTYTNSKFNQVKEGAARILKNNGISINLPKDNRQVFFKFFVDNKELNNVNLYWEIYSDSTSYSRRASSSSSTSSQGIITLQKDLILSTNKGKGKIKFTSDLFGNKNSEYFFDYQTSIPTNFSDTLIINIPTSKVILNLKLNRDKGFYKNKTMEIFLGSYLSINSLQYSCDVKEVLELTPKIQKGKEYSLQIDVPGSRKWIGSVDLVNDTQYVDVDLQSGTSITFKILAPGGKMADDDVMFELEKSNSSWEDHFIHDYELNGYRSLPAGEYTLRILSSKEKKIKLDSGAWSKNEILPDFEPYDGKEIKFSIAEDSPDQIDLGIIKLDPINK